MLNHLMTLLIRLSTAEFKLCHSYRELQKKVDFTTIDQDYVVAVQKRVAFDTSDFGTLLSYNKCIRNPGFQTFPVHLRN